MRNLKRGDRMNNDGIKNVWIVTYWDRDQEPTVTAFDNEETAKRCYETFRPLHDGICLDCVPLYHSFYEI